MKNNLLLKHDDLKFMSSILNETPVTDVEMISVIQARATLLAVAELREIKSKL